MSFWDEVRNLIRREVAAAMTLRGRTRTGLVDSYDPSTHAVKVRLQPENVLSGWIPVGTLRSGNGAGVFFAPNIGDQVVVEPLEGDHDSRVCTLRLYSTVDQPLNVPAGQIWLQDDAGSFVKFDNAGNLSISAASGKVSITASGGEITLTAPTVAISGNLAVSGGISAQGDVQGASISLQNHVHTGVTAGGSTTGPATG